VSSASNSVAQIGIVLGSLFAFTFVPITVVTGLFFSGAHLGFEGYFEVGVAIGSLILVPGTGASILAGWLVDRRTPEGRRPFAILVGIVTIFQLAGIAAIIIASARVGANVGVPLGLIIPAIVLTLWLLWIGERIGRRDAARAAALPVPPEDSVLSIAPLNIRRTIWTLAATLVGSGLIAMTYLIFFTNNFEGDGASARRRSADLNLSLSTAVAISFFVVAIVASIMTFRYAANVKEQFRGSYLSQKAITGSVMRRRVTTLDADLRAASVRYAILLTNILVLSLVSALASFVGVAFSRIGDLSLPSDRANHALDYGLIGIIAAAAAIVTVIQIRRIRNVRHYLEVNAPHLLNQPEL
jgi:hypothetical protein